ncbi:hypothetical protein ABID58_007589, partial [Bradyrhizobium sp. S3.2.6]|uniref:hypothetical protein n=1 Tax=Bradyrhizobium sp. S3.2.6 TaxID=3156428 RepID=UPI003398B191
MAGPKSPVDIFEEVAREHGGVFPRRLIIWQLLALSIDTGRKREADTLASKLERMCEEASGLERRFGWDWT